MITENEISTYLRDEIAVKNKLIAHSDSKCRYAASLEEAELLMKNKLDTANFFMVMEILNGNFNDNEGDSYEDLIPINIFVLKKVSGSDQEAVKAVEDGAKEILRQVISKLLRDHVAQHEIWKWLEPGQMPYTKAEGSMMNNCYGYFITLNLRVPFDLTYDASEWN